jgi:hypothetical protein
MDVSLMLVGCRFEHLGSNLTPLRPLSSTLPPLRQKHHTLSHGDTCMGGVGVGVSWGDEKRRKRLNDQAHAHGSSSLALAHHQHAGENVNENEDDEEGQEGDEVSHGFWRLLYCTDSGDCCTTWILAIAVLHGFWQLLYYMDFGGCCTTAVQNLQCLSLPF